MTRKFSSTSVATTLASGINSTATSIVVATGTSSALMGGVTLAAGNVDSFAVAIDVDTINEEIVWVTQRSGDTLTVVRAQAGTTNIAHTAGATVKHVLTGDDATFFTAGVATANAAVPESVVTAKGDVLVASTSGVVDNLAVGTNGQVLTADSTQALGTKWSTPEVTLAGAETLTNKNLTSGTNTFPTSLTTLTGTQTLTNKDLTSGTNTFPSTLATTSTTQTLSSKTLASPTVTGTFTAGGSAGTNGQVLSSTGTGIQWTSTSAGYTQPTIGSTAIPSGSTVSTISALTLSAPTLTGTVTAGGSAGTSGQVLSSTGTGVQWTTAAAGYSQPTIGSTAIPSGATVTTIAGLTLTSPTINSGSLATPTVTNGYVISPKEKTVVSATAATGTVNFDVLTQGVLYYTSDASANWTLNFRGNSGTTLNSLMSVGDSWSVVFINTSGTTAYYPTVFQIDGSAVTPKWVGGTAPSAGNASSLDSYTFTIIKTASTPTYTVLAGQARFA
jgi:hypothetical protein